MADFVLLYRQRPLQSDILADYPLKNVKDFTVAISTVVKNKNKNCRGNYEKRAKIEKNQRKSH